MRPILESMADERAEWRKAMFRILTGIETDIPVVVPARMVITLTSDIDEMIEELQFMREQAMATPPPDYGQTK